MSYDSDVYLDEYGLYNYHCKPCKTAILSDSKKGAEELKRKHLVERHGFREMLIPPKYAERERGNPTVEKALRVDRKLRRKLR